MGTRFIPAVLDVIFRLVSGGTKTISHRQVEPILDAATENALVNVCLKFCVLQHDLLPWFEAPEIGEHDEETFMLFLKSFFFFPQDSSKAATFKRVVDALKGAEQTLSRSDVGSAVLKNICTIQITGKDYADQYWMLCHTCWPNENKVRALLT